jgi:hypothetical protein
MPATWLIKALMYRRLGHEQRMRYPKAGMAWHYLALANSGQIGTMDRGERSGSSEIDRLGHRGPKRPSGSDSSMSAQIL